METLKNQVFCKLTDSQQAEAKRIAGQNGLALSSWIRMQIIEAIKRAHVVAQG